jgi:excinuclease ABC subunit A
LGDFAETNWNHRSVVEIAASTKSLGWFFHAHTGMERMIRLVFRVGRNKFKQAELNERLGIRPLNEIPGLQVYGDEERVHVANRKGPWQEIAILALQLSEVDTPAFRAFLSQAVSAFNENLRRMRLKPEDVMPWKLNGERWHLGDKGFAPGKKIQWERSLLTRLLNLVRDVEPGLQVEWNGRAAIRLRVPGVSRAWSEWRTKESYGLDCRFLGKKGQFNLSQIESLGISPTIKGERDYGDLLRLVFQNPDHIHPGKLKPLLSDHLKGFRETFAKENS